MDWGVARAPSLPLVESPTPRPIASAAMNARRRQEATARRFLSSLLLASESPSGGAADDAVGGGASARMVRPSFEWETGGVVIRFPAVMDTTTGFTPTGSNSILSEDAISRGGVVGGAKGRCENGREVGGSGSG
jgi:hypothetical protein